MSRSYYVSTAEGLEMVSDVITMRPVIRDNSPVWEVMTTDSRLDEGLICFDYVRIDASHTIYQAFLNRHIARHGSL